MPEIRTLNKKQALRVDLINQGWIPSLVVHLDQLDAEHYSVNSASTIGCRYLVIRNPVLGLCCEHEYTLHNDGNPCSHIQAVQEFLYSEETCISFSQEVQVQVRYKNFKANRVQEKWEWAIFDSNKCVLGCIGVTIENNQAIWRVMYQKTFQYVVTQDTFDSCQHALEFLEKNFTF